MMKAGLGRIKVPEGQEELPPNLNIHGLRKLAASNLAEAGCSTKEIAAITGHETLAMIELYTKSADQKRLATAAIHRLQTFTKLTNEQKIA
jgi:integrase